MDAYTWMLASAGVFIFIVWPLVLAWVIYHGSLDDDPEVLPKCFGRKPRERRGQENTGCPQCPYYTSCGYRPRNGG